MSLQSTDQIADLITRIRNASMVGKNQISVPTSKLKVAIVEVLVKSGYLDSFRIKDAKPRGILNIIITQTGTTPRINEIKKVSKPGRRVYVSANEIPTVKSGRGTVIISTPKGLMTGRDAKKNRLGGEVLIQVW